MYNKIILQGNLTRDVEIRYSTNGTAIAKVGIAVNRKFKAATGEQREEVLFIDLNFFGRTAEIANQYLHKGSQVLVDGRLKLDQWTAQDESKRSAHSVTVENLQMIGGNENRTQPAESGVPVETYGVDGSHQGTSNYNQPAAGHGGNQPNPQPTSNIPEIDINEDEIPF